MRYLLLLFVLCSNVFGQFIRTDANTVALWVFDDVYHAGQATGLSIDESIVNSHTLVPVNFSANYATELVSGSTIYPSGNVLDFVSASSQYLYVPDANAAAFKPGTNDFTIEFVLKIEGTFTTTSHLHPLWLLGNGNINGNTVYFYLRSGSFNGMVLRYGDGLLSVDTQPTINQSANMADGEFHSIAFSVENGATTKLYLDGVEVGSGIITLVGNVSIGTSNAFIGQSFLTFYNNCQIAAVKYSDKVRTAAEIVDFGSIVLDLVKSTQFKGNKGFSGFK